MEFKNSFLSRLFGMKPEEQEPPEEEDNHPDVPSEGAPPEKPERHTLDLPREHSLFKLRSLYSEQFGWLPLPVLTLEVPGEPPLPESEAQAELLRLKMAVNNSANKRFELLRTQHKETETSSLPDLDAQVTVFLSKDGLSSWVLIYPPVGDGREVEWSDLDRALAEQEVCWGIDRELLNAIPQDRERYFRLFRVARGTAAVNGTDGRIVDLFPRTEERKLTVDENNRADYTDLHFIHNVEKDGVICHIIPPTDGIPGKTVQGKEVPPKTGNRPQCLRGATRRCRRTARRWWPR